MDGVQSPQNGEIGYDHLIVTIWTEIYLRVPEGSQTCELARSMKSSSDESGLLITIIGPFIVALLYVDLMWNRFLAHLPIFSPFFAPFVSLNIWLGFVVQWLHLKLPDMSKMVHDMQTYLYIFIFLRYVLVRGIPKSCHKLRLIPNSRMLEQPFKKVQMHGEPSQNSIDARLNGQTNLTSVLLTCPNICPWITTNRQTETSTRVALGYYDLPLKKGLWERKDAFEMVHAT